METIVENNITILTAAEGMELVRKADGMHFGSKIYLGMNYHAEPPRMEVAEDFEETPETPKTPQTPKRDLREDN